MNITISGSTLMGAGWGALAGAVSGTGLVLVGVVISGVASFGGFGPTDEFGPAFRKGMARVVPITTTAGAIIGGVVGAFSS